MDAVDLQCQFPPADRRMQHHTRQTVAEAGVEGLGHRRLLARRATLPVEIDGSVIKVEQLALQPTQFFNQVFAELVTLPALRNDMLARLRDPERSEALGQAIGRLFASV